MTHYGPEQGSPVQPWTVRPKDGWIAQEFGMISRDDSLLNSIGWDEDSVVERFKEQLAPYCPEWIYIEARTDVVVTERVERVIRNGRLTVENVLEGGTTHREIVVSGAVWLAPDALDLLRRQPWSR
jgi:hypothetical protein